MPTCSICEQPCRALQLVRVPARSRDDGPFDEWAEQMVGECCIGFLDAMFHGAGKGWDTLIASSGEVERIRNQSKARRH